MDYQDVFIKKLLYYLDRSEKRPADLSKDLGIPKSTISSWVNKQRFPKMNTIEDLATYFNIKKSDLLEMKVDTPAYSPITHYPFIPSTVAAGIPCTIEGIKKLPTVGISDAVMGKWAGSKHILIMKVNGESMNKVIPNGSFVAVKTDIEVSELKEGDTVVFNTAHEYSLKHYHKVGDKIIFKPDSTDPRYFDQVYTNIEDIAIVGKVVKYIVSLE